MPLLSKCDWSAAAAAGSQQQAQPDETRRDLLVLNAAIRNKGAPIAHFGRSDSHVGRIAFSRLELCSLGLHRHVWSEATYAAGVGVESLVLTPASRCDDLGERIHYRGAGADTAQLAACLLALAANAEKQRPVRVLRADKTTAASHALPGQPSALASSHRRDCFRYDGLYSVLRPESDAPSGLVHFLLIRQPGQPSLPPYVGEAGRRAAAANGRNDAHGDAVAWGAPSELSLTGEVERIAAAAGLPRLAEESIAEACGANVSVGEAIAKLTEMRAELLARLGPGESYALAKRSLVAQVHIRSAIEMLEPPPCRSASRGRGIANGLAINGGATASASRKRPREAFCT